MDLLADFLHFGATDFLLKILFKSASNRLFFALASRSGFGATISRPLRVVLCVLQFSLCRSHCNGCVKVASCCGCIGNTIVFCSWDLVNRIGVAAWRLRNGFVADFLHFGTSVFLLHVGLEQCEVWGVKSAVWSVKCEGSSGKWEVWSVSVKCEVWSVEV